MATRQENIATMRMHGQYPTPQWIIDLMLRILKPQPDAVAVDPGCGTGVIVERLLEHGVQHVDAFDIDSYMVSATKTLVGDRAHIEQRDVLLAGLPQLYDVQIVNPPFSPPRTDTAAKFRCKSPNPALQTVEVCLNALTPGGRLAVILDEGTCSRKTDAAARQTLMQDTIVEAIIDLGDEAFREEAGTTFGTSIVIMKHGSPAVNQKTRFARKTAKASKLQVLGDIPYSEIRRQGDWFFGAYEKASSTGGPRLGDFVEHVKETFAGENLRNPIIDPLTRLLVHTKRAPKKTQACRAGCLYLPRIVSGDIRCGVVTSDFDAAGTTAEYFILQPKRSSDLAWLWHELNTSEQVAQHLNATARGTGRRRVQVDDLLRMPVTQPGAASIAKADKTLQQAQQLRAVCEKFQRKFAKR